MADDILCYGSEESIKEALADHDRNLVNLLKCTSSVNLKFKGLSHGTSIVFLSKLHKYNSLLPLLVDNIFL